MQFHQHFMNLAIDEARKALANNEFPVGCVMVYEGEVVATGSRKNSKFFNSQQSANELDHAEIVALRQLVSHHPDIDRSKVSIYSTMEPCLMCFSTLILNNIHMIIYAYEDVMGGGTNLPLHRLAPLYKKMQVKVVPHIMRQESLELFCAFFNSPSNNYWQDSLLASYTLEQQKHSQP